MIRLERQWGEGETGKKFKTTPDTGGKSDSVDDIQEERDENGDPHGDDVEEDEENDGQRG